MDLIDRPNQSSKLSKSQVVSQCIPVLFLLMEATPGEIFSPLMFIKESFLGKNVCLHLTNGYHAPGSNLEHRTASYTFSWMNLFPHNLYFHSIPSAEWIFFLKYFCVHSYSLRRALVSWPETRISVSSASKFLKSSFGSKKSCLWAIILNNTKILAMAMWRTASQPSTSSRASWNYRFELWLCWNAIKFCKNLSSEDIWDVENFTITMQPFEMVWAILDKLCRKSSGGC